MSTIILWIAPHSKICHHITYDGKHTDFERHPNGGI